MRIQFASDLHLEFEENSRFLEDYPLIPCGDILILAGDIGYLEGSTYDEYPFWDWASNRYDRVLVIPGNKEFYGSYDLSKLRNGMKVEIRKNIHWYYNMSEVINDIEFLMTPLWSFIPITNADTVKTFHPDFKFIQFKNKALSIDIYNKLHNQCIEFLMKGLSEVRNKRVIVTHHAPSFQCATEEFKDSLLNCAFYSDMEKLIRLYNPEYWIYGHSHRNINNLKIGKTILISNQLGYVNKTEHKEFNRSTFFTV